MIKILLFVFSVCSLFAQMTGDWNGLRQRAKEAGIFIYAAYANDLLGNPIGGDHRGFANAGSFDLSCDLNLEKIFHIPQTIIHSSFNVRHGNNLSAKKIGNQFSVAQLFGRETYGLGELFLMKSAANERWMMKVGRLSGGNDFFASPLYLSYVNNAFCGNPVSIFYNTLFTAYPNATWGAYTQVKPTPNFLIKFACYNTNKNVFKDKYHGVYFRFKSTQGVMFLSEWGYSLQGNLPGNYRVGGYYITGSVPQIGGGSKTGNYGYYFLIDQMVLHKGPRQVIPFAALLFATPTDRNQFPFFLTGGAVCQGLFPGRDQDQLSLGVAYGSYSSAIRPKQSAETVLELNYWAWVKPWMAIIPDVQYIINPKGFGTIPNAFVLGMQVVINL